MYIISYYNLNQKPQVSDLAILASKKTENSLIVLYHDGILRQYTKKGTKATYDTAIESFNVLKDMLNGKEGLLMSDISGCLETSLEARNFYASPEFGKHFKAIALVVNSATSEVIGNFMLGINKMTSPTKLFKSETDAIAWLKSNFL